MKHIVAVLALLIGMCFMIITSIAGLLIVPIIALITLLFPIKSNEKEYSVDVGTLSPLDHTVDVTIDYVPPMYYEQYSAYLKSPQWKELRKVVLRRDKYRCVDCGVKAYHNEYCPEGSKLQVHHIHYDGIDTMTFHPDQLVSVCHTCHDKRHGRH